MARFKEDFVKDHLFCTARNLSVNLVRYFQIDVKPGKSNWYKSTDVTWMSTLNRVDHNL